MQDVPKIVRARLQRPMPESHPDADLLTAFAEQALTGRERDGVVEHLARCGDCREVVALALPATEAAAVTRTVRPARTGWFSWPVLRWGVVAAGILTVTSVGVLQYRQRHLEKTLVATRLISQDQLAENPQSAAPASASPVAAVQAEMGKQTVTREKAQPSQSALAADKRSSANAIFPQARSLPRASSAGVFGGVRGGMNSAGGRYNPTPAPAQPVPSATTTVEVSGAAPLVTTETSVQNQFHGAAVQNEPVEQSQALDYRVGKAKPALAQASPMAPAPLLRPDPSLMKGPAERWTISAGGALQRSLDGGKTWVDVEIAVDDSMSANLARPVKAPTTTETQTELKSQAKAAKSMARYDAPPNARAADVAPASRVIFRAVCVSSNAAEVWAGGSSGALYHTLDGGNLWTRVVPSDPSGTLTGDVVGIQFSDLRNGTVTTSAADIWTTADDGQSWHKQP